MQVNLKTGRKFFVIIDEWDALFREAKSNEKVQHAYIQFLRSLFKSGQTSQMISGAYMAGLSQECWRSLSDLRSRRSMGYVKNTGLILTRHVSGMTDIGLRALDMCITRNPSWKPLIACFTFFLHKTLNKKPRKMTSSM